MPAFSTPVLIGTPLWFCTRAPVGSPPSLPPLSPVMGLGCQAGAARAAAGPAPGWARIQARRRGTALPLPSGCACSGDTVRGRGRGIIGTARGSGSVQILPLVRGETALGPPLPAALWARRSAAARRVAKVPHRKQAPGGPTGWVWGGACGCCGSMGWACGCAYHCGGWPCTS